jgi:hypothetical protein
MTVTGLQCQALDTRKQRPYKQGMPLLQQLALVGHDKLVSNCFNTAANRHPHRRRQVALADSHFWCAKETQDWLRAQHAATCAKPVN